MQQLFDKFVEYLLLTAAGISFGIFILITGLLACGLILTIVPFLMYLFGVK